MLISHTIKYLPAQVLSAAAQLASVALLTHWLLPEDMGVFTLVTAAQEIAFMLALQWFSLYLLRYLPRANELHAHQQFLHTESAVVVGSVLTGFGIGLVTALTLPASASWWWATLSVGGFFVTRALNAHYAERARAQSAFLAYTLFQVAGPVGGLALGFLAFQSEGLPHTAFTMLACYALAQGLGTVLAWPMLGIAWKFAWPDKVLLKAAIAFGAPLLGTQLIGWGAENYIRYLVQWQLGAGMLGLMVVGWSLGRRCASVVSMLAATAAYPIAARLLNEGKREEALAQLSMNAALMLAIMLPVTAGMELLGPTIVGLVVAPAYREITSSLLAMSVLGGALRNLHLHVTDQLLVLERKLEWVVAVSVVEVIACVAASWLGLQWYGILGAVAGQALGSLVAFGLSLYWVTDHLQFRWPWMDSLRIAVATLGMAWLVYWQHSDATWWGLLLSVVVGFAGYVALCGILFLPRILFFIKGVRAA